VKEILGLKCFMSGFTTFKSYLPELKPRMMCS